MQIVTPRYLIRDFTEGDRVAFLAYHRDPRYLALPGRDRMAPEHLVETFGAWAAERPRLNYQLAVVHKVTDVLVGCCGLRGAGCREGQAELGIELAPDYWGRHGVAIEIARALIAFGFEDLGLRQIFGVTTSTNRRALRLAAWFGATETGQRPGPDDSEETEWQISREAWRASPRTGGLRTSRPKA